MSKKLSQIQIPIKAELKQFEEYFEEIMSTKVPLLDKITNYIIQTKGKQLRPMITLLSAKICGDLNDSSYTAASLVEIIHTATLVHDDVVDEAEKRRGFFSIFALWKTKIAVLVGDYLLSKGLNIALEKKEYATLHIINQAVQAMSEGELMQIEKARKLDIQEDVYFEIIRQKTATLIAAACKAGASSSTTNVDHIEGLYRFGEKIGIAFQIKDDLFDYGDDDGIGKPTGIDIKEKKMTLPLIFALQKASWVERKKIIFNIKRRSKNKKVVSDIIAFVKASGGLQYAEEKMHDYQNQALEILKSLPQNEATLALKELVFYVTTRKK